MHAVPAVPAIRSGVHSSWEAHEVAQSPFSGAWDRVTFDSLNDVGDRVVGHVVI